MLLFVHLARPKHPSADLHRLPLTRNAPLLPTLSLTRNARLLPIIPLTHNARLPPTIPLSPTTPAPYPHCLPLTHNARLLPTRPLSPTMPVPHPSRLPFKTMPISYPQYLSPTRNTSLTSNALPVPLPFYPQCPPCTCTASLSPTMPPSYPQYLFPPQRPPIPQRLPLAHNAGSGSPGTSLLPTASG